MSLERSPYDCGHNDYYYWRSCRAHKKGADGHRIYDLTPEEVADYGRGWEDSKEDGRKKW